MLKYRCTIAARLALVEAPIDASREVTQVPMFWPRIMGTAAEQLIAPVLANACRIPTEAEEL